MVAKMFYAINYSQLLAAQTRKAVSFIDVLMCSSSTLKSPKVQ